MASPRDFFEERRPFDVEGAIVSIEQRLGRALPSDYIAFLAAWGGGYLATRAECPVPDDCAFEESWVQIGEILNVERQLEAIASLERWEHLVRGVVIDRLDSHRAVILAVGDESLADGTVAMSVLEGSVLAPTVVALAPTFTDFMERLRTDVEASDTPAVLELTAPTTTDAQVKAAVANLKGRAVALRAVVVRGVNVTSEVCQTFVSLKGLETLDVSRTSVGIEGLVALRGLTITSLDIRGTPIELTQAVAVELQRSLGWLIRLRLEPHQLPERSRAWVERQWPGLELDVTRES